MPDTRERLVEILEGAGKMIQFPGTLANILIENGVTVGDKWIPTAVRLPEPDVWVLMVDKYLNLVSLVKRTYSDSALDIGGEVGPLEIYTHWMPLPEPPKEVVHES